jgi:hypothetical protein
LGEVKRNPTNAMKKTTKLSTLRIVNWCDVVLGYGAIYICCVVANISCAPAPNLQGIAIPLRSTILSSPDNAVRLFATTKLQVTRFNQKFVIS